MKIALALLALTLGGLSAAACPIAVEDLSPALAPLAGQGGVLVTTARDPDSDEPVRRSVLALDGGALLVIEQKHCSIRNLRVTLLSPAARPSEADLDAMAAALAATPTWTAGFSDRDARAALGRMLAAPELASATGETVAMDDHLAARRQSSEVLLTRMQSASDIAQFAGVLTLAISLGGL